MLTNLNDDFEDNNQENIQDSQSEDENPNEPLINLNISLNNGKKTNLTIYEGENIEQKVKQFCLNNKISPKDEKILLEKVKEEIESKPPSQLETMNYDNRNTNKTIKEPKDIQNIVPKFMDYLPEEKNKLDHILNESESISVSESVRQSNKNFETEKEYISKDINKFYKESEGESSVSQSRENEIPKEENKSKNILNNIEDNNAEIDNNNSIKDNIENNKNEINNIPKNNYFNNNNSYLPKQNIILNGNKANYDISKVNYDVSNGNYEINNGNYDINNFDQNNLIINTQPNMVYQVKTNGSEYNNNLSNNNNLNNANKIGYTTKLSNINNINNYTNNKEINKYNSEYINNNHLLTNDPGTSIYKLNNTYQTINPNNNMNYVNQIQTQNNPFSSLLNQKIEFLDYNSPKTESLSYTINQNDNINYQNPKESIICNYEPYEVTNYNKIISKNNPIESIAYNNEINAINKNDSIIYNFNQNTNNNNNNYEYINYNNPKKASINYDNIINKQDNNYIINQTSTINGKLDNPVLEYKNSYNNINGQKYNTYNNDIKNQIIENKNIQGISKLEYNYINNKNNQYPINKDIPKQNFEKNNRIYNYNVEMPQEQFSIIENSNSNSPIIENVNYQIINNNSQLINQSKNMENIKDNNKIQYINNNNSKVNIIKKNNVIDESEKKNFPRNNESKNNINNSQNSNINESPIQSYNENIKKENILPFDNKGLKNSSEIQGEFSSKEKEISFNNNINSQISSSVKNSNNSNYQIVTNEIMLKKIEEKKQKDKQNELSEENLENNTKEPHNSPSRKKEEINVMNSSNLIDVDYSNEIKNKERDENTNQKESLNDISNEVNNIILDDTIEEKEPQDNCKKKRIKSDLPKDTDEINYKESQIKTESNNSFQSEHKKNTISINESNNSKNNINLNNNENSYNITNNSKNVNNSNKKSINNSITSSYNQIINELEINNSINNSNSNHKNNDIKEYLEISNHKYKNEDNKNRFNNNEIYEPNIVGKEYGSRLTKELVINKPKYRNTQNNLEYQQSQSYQSSAMTDRKNIKIPKKQEIQKKNINKKPLKVFTIRNKFDYNNNINKRSNSSGARRNNKYNDNLPGVRLYREYMDKMNKKSQYKERLLNEKLEEENKNIYSSPKINANSRRIVERMRNNEENKVEDRLINYGYNQRQKRLIQLANKDIRSRTESPCRPKIKSTSRNIAARNKNNRINQTINLMEEKKNGINYKKIDLEKEFGKKNRSIGKNHKNKNSFINFNDSKNSEKITNLLLNKNKIKYRKQNNNKKEENYNINSYRNTNNTISSDNKTNMSQLNKTLELNNAYRDLYNSIDDKNDTELTKFFGNNLDLNSNLKEDNNQERRISNLSEIKNNNLFSENRRAVTPPSYSNKYNAFDYLYYESEILEEKNKKKQELDFKRNHPFKPRISPYSQKINNNRKETTKDFLSRNYRNLEEIKIKNSKCKRSINAIPTEQNSFRPKITRGPKNPNQRNINNYEINCYNKKLKQKTIDLQKLQKEDEIEKKNLFNKKSKDIIMQMKFKKYRELFNQLDSDHDGFISSSKIHLTKIDQNVLKNISPILESLNQTNRQMNFKEFCLKIDKLMTQK